MTFTAEQIAQLVNGKIEGDPKIVVDSFGKIEEARAGQLAFLANPKYEEYLYTTNASLVLINADFILKQKINSTLVRVPDAYKAFAILLAKYEEMVTRQVQGIQQPVYIAKSATYGKDVFIGAFAYLGENVSVGNNTKIFPHVFIGDNAKVGDNTILHPGVKIYHDCIVGDRVIIHAGTVIGSDGFGFAFQADGTPQKIPQLGNVIIEDEVEIGGNAALDRATIGSTVVKKGAKLDNMVHVAHNVEIGSNTMIAAQVALSGSVKLGKGVMIGGQAGIAGHIHVADGSKINAQAGLGKNLKTATSVTGSPAYEYGQAIRNQSLARNLVEMEKRLSDLEKMIKQIYPAKADNT
ncbi:MAG TPA: UDP-3-O-(3-hydroxymyristoyl)glucosamine N-acyltransferase [Chitinophagaceae bacterium]|nr:UDP-3-O-(3-hydroxymyristoyl)glucosamine N-acyltransferase [Chitinophagaceae bacterium]